MQLDKESSFGSKQMAHFCQQKLDSPGFFSMLIFFKTLSPVNFFPLSACILVDNVLLHQKLFNFSLCFSVQWLYFLFYDSA